jgi:hypothetical protein
LKYGTIIAAAADEVLEQPQGLAVSPAGLRNGIMGNLLTWQGTALIEDG